MSKKRNVFLIGPMGAGKSSIGRQIAKELRLDFYDSDEEIVKRTGADIPWIYDVEGEEGFRSREVKVLAELAKLSGVVLATGGGSVARANNRKVLANYGIVVYLKASLQDQLERTGYSRKRPLSSQTAERRKMLENYLEELKPMYEEIADIVCNTDNCSVKSAALCIVRELRKKGYFSHG